MSARRTVVFDWRALPEQSGTGYPPSLRAGLEGRFYRRAGAHGGLAAFGVNFVRLAPGGVSSQRHWHSKQDEFVLVLEGELVLETDAAPRTLGPGQCAAFPAGSGDGHRLANRSARDAVFLVVGDRPAGDVVEYPDVDLRAECPDGDTWRYTHRDGTPW